MIQYTQGNLLEANVEVLVNTVNTVGVMGKGIVWRVGRTKLTNCNISDYGCFSR